MKLKTVTQYLCDFCGKKGYSASYMHRHEKHCTLNPQRICRMCKLVEAEQVPIEELKALLPNHNYDSGVDEGGSFGPTDEQMAQLRVAVKVLRDKTEGCPACMMAALRQKHIPVPAVGEWFNFKRECLSIWEGFNLRQFHHEND